MTYSTTHYWLRSFARYYRVLNFTLDSDYDGMAHSKHTGFFSSEDFYYTGLIVTVVSTVGGSCFPPPSNTGILVSYK